MYCWKNIEDYLNVDGERELPVAKTGFTRFILLNERPPDRYTRSGERPKRKQTTSRPDDVWPGMWIIMSVAATKKAKLIEPNDEEFKLQGKPLVESWMYALQNTDEEQCGTHRKIGSRRMHESKTRRSWTQNLIKINLLHKGRIL